MSKIFASQIVVARKRVKRLIGIQTLLVSLIALLMLSFSTERAAYSALLGGLICILPTTYFAWRAFRYSGARSAKQIVQAFYLGEAAKLFITMVLFVAVFKYISISALPFFISFILAQMMIWLTPLLFKA